MFLSPGDSIQTGPIYGGLLSEAGHFQTIGSQNTDHTCNVSPHPHTPGAPPTQERRPSLAPEQRTDSVSRVYKG